MIILEVRIKDWCQHPLIQFMTNSPVVGVFGPNGKGKSNFLLALNYAYTGLLPRESSLYVRNGAKKTEVYVKFLQHGKIGEITRKITKSGTTSRALIWGDSKEPITSAKEVDAVLSEILGADRQAIDNAVFIPQGMVHTILFGDKAAKETLFTRVVNVAYLEKLVGIIDSRIKQESETVEDLGIFLDELRSQLAVACKSESDIGVEYARLPDNTTALRWARSLQAAENAAITGKTDAESAGQTFGIADRELSSELRQHEFSDVDQLMAKQAAQQQEREVLYAQYSQQRTVKSRRDQRRSDTEALARARFVLARLQSEESDLRTNLNGVDIGTLSNRIADLNNREQLTVRAGQLAEKHEAAKVSYNKIAANPVNHTERRAAIADERTKLSEKGGTLKQTIDVLTPIITQAAAPSCNCPVCNQAIDAMLVSRQRYDALVEERQQAENKFRALGSEATRLEQEQSVYENAMRAASLAFSSTLKDLTDVKRSQAAIPEGDKGAVTAEFQLASARQSRLTQLERSELPNANAEVLRLSQALSGLTPEALLELDTFDETAFNSLSGRLGNLSTSLQATTAVVRVVQERLRSYNEKKTAYEEAKKRLNFAELDLSEKRKTHPWMPGQLPVEVAFGFTSFIAGLEEKERVRSETLGRVNQARVNREGLAVRVREAETRVLRAEKQRVLVDGLRKLRETFSRPGLPMTFVEYQFQKLVPITQYQLNRMGATFSVEAHPERKLCFRFIKPTEPDAEYQDMEALSGGERARLCIAFLMAIQQLLIPDVGLLVLDEPSTHVDADGKEAMRDMFISAASTLQNSSHQIWMVDHDPILQRAAGAILEVGG